MAYSISQIAGALSLQFRGDGERIIARVAAWDDADETSLVFWDRGASDAPMPDPPSCGCVIARENAVHPRANVILSERPKLDFARAAALLSPLPAGSGLRHPTAVISGDSEIGEDVDVGPCVVIETGARIGKGSVIHAGVAIGAGVVLGERCTLFPRVVIYPGASLGSRVVLHAGTVIGSDGFGYVFDGRDQVKFPQAGRVVIEDDVEIGANTTIDRGSLGTTRIGEGAKIDNLVQIAHNVEIGRRVVIAAQTGISGSTVVEDFAVIGGQVGFGDHCRVQSGAVIGSKAGILPGKIVRGGDVYWGVPVRPLREYKRLNALFGRLPEMKERIDALRKELEELKRLHKEKES